MAKAKTKTRTTKRAPTKKRTEPSAWQKFRRSKPGRILIVLFIYAALLAFIAWISGKNLSRFLLLTGILFVLTMVFAWLLYMTLRDRGDAAKTKKARTR